MIILGHTRLCEAEGDLGLKLIIIHILTVASLGLKAPKNGLGHRNALGNLGYIICNTVLVVIFRLIELTLIVFNLKDKSDACVYKCLTAKSCRKKFYGNIDFLKYLKIGAPSYN